MTDPDALNFADAVWDTLAIGLHDPEDVDKDALRTTANRFYFSDDSANNPSLRRLYWSTLSYCDGHSPLTDLARASQVYEAARLTP